jgi:hypothetical protein
MGGTAWSSAFKGKKIVLPSTVAQTWAKLHLLPNQFALGGRGDPGVDHGHVILPKGKSGRCQVFRSDAYVRANERTVALVAL